MPLLRKKTTPNFLKTIKFQRKLFPYSYDHSLIVTNMHIFSPRKILKELSIPYNMKCQWQHIYLIWNPLKNNTLTAAEFQMQTGLVSSWSYCQYQWMRLTNSIAATPPHRHKICFKDSLKKTQTLMDSVNYL